MTTVLQKTSLSLEPSLLSYYTSGVEILQLHLGRSPLGEYLIQGPPLCAERLRSY